MNTFVLVQYDEESDGCELLGVFASKEEALESAGEIERDRQTLDLDEGTVFELEDPTSPNIGVMPGGRDPTREFRVLAKQADAEDDETEDDETEDAVETDDTDYYVLEF